MMGTRHLVKVAAVNWTHLETLLFVVGAVVLFVIAGIALKLIRGRRDAD